MVLICLSWTVFVYASNRIMMIGDSITRGIGSSDGLGFRDELGERLTQIGYPFSYVGIFGDAPYQGHFQSGAMISQFYTGPGGDGSLDVGYDMDENVPTVVVIHSGTNDVFSGGGMVPYTTTETATWRLKNLIEYIVEWHDGTRGDHIHTIFVSQIVPNTTYPERVGLFNDGVAQLVQDANDGLIQRIPPGVLKLVDQHSSFVMETMLNPDGIHPNDIGYDNMTDVLFDAFGALPMYLERVSYDEVRGAPWSQVSLTARVTDRDGNGVSGRDVTFQVTEGDAILLDGQPVRTDDLGLAHCRFRLGGLGESTVTVNSPDLIVSTVTFRLTSTQVFRIEGRILYHHNQQPVSNVQMEWVERASFMGTTDGEGCFNIDQFQYGDVVTLRPMKFSNPSQSPILSWDASLVSRHVVGAVELTPDERLAADVDSDGRLTMNDAVHIARYTVGITPPGHIRAGEWKFIPDHVYYSSIASDKIHQDFEGVLLGDVHGGWNNQGLPKREGISDWVVSVCSESAGLQEIEVNVTADGGELFACDFICRYDSSVLEFVSVNKTRQTQPFQLNFRQSETGTLRVGMFATNPIFGKQPILNLRFKRKMRTEPYIVSFRNIYMNDCRVEDIVLSPADSGYDDLADALSLMPNVPNPFNEETVFRFNVPDRSQVLLRVFNGMGREVVTLVDEEKPKGRYEIRWDGRDDRGRIVSSGVYYCRISTDNDHVVRKMIKLR